MKNFIYTDDMIAYKNLIEPTKGYSPSELRKVTELKINVQNECISIYQQQKISEI